MRLVRLAGGRFHAVGVGFVSVDSMADSPCFRFRSARGWLAFGLIAAVLAGLGGCGGEPFKLVPVRGKVSYSDGSLIPGDQIFVQFIPQQAARSGKDVAPAAIGEVDPKDGTFPGVTSHTYLDGTVPGRHKVTVVAMKMGPEGLMAPTKAVAERYQRAETTPLEWDVGHDKDPAEFKIEKGH